MLGAHSLLATLHLPFLNESPQMHPTSQQDHSQNQRNKSATPLACFGVMQCFSCGFRLCVCAFVLLSLSLHCNVRGPVGFTRHLFKRGRKQPYGVAPDSLHVQTHSADTSLCTEDVSEDVPDFPLTLDSGGHGVDDGVVLSL